MLAQQYPSATILIFMLIMGKMLAASDSLMPQDINALNHHDIDILLTSDRPLVFLSPRYKTLLTILNDSIITVDALQAALEKIDSETPLHTLITQKIIPISATITQDSTQHSTTCHLYKCHDASPIPSVSYADFTITFNDIDPNTTKHNNLSMSTAIDQENYNGIVPLCKSLDDSYIKLSSENNVDMRLTGSATFLGLVTLPGAAKKTASGSPLVINTAGQLGVGSVCITNGKDLSVTGSVKFSSVKNLTSPSSACIVIDTTTGQLATNTIQNPTYTFSSDAFIAKGSTFWTGRISPRSPTTTTTFNGSISLPSSTTANNGSLHINGTPFLHNFGTNNTFAGASAGNLKMSGAGNTAIGSGSLAANTTAANNTAVGFNSLNSNTTGAGNIALGQGSGSALTTGSNNIDIGNAGVAAESNTIRIGTQGTQTACFIAGISNNTIIGSAVSINGSGQVGVVLSSQRYKNDIKDMDTASSNLSKLRPVTFTYKDAQDTSMQYGLIAEEVATVYPNLVVYKEGLPESVRYDALPAMLLNEYQQLRKDYDEINDRLKKLEQS